MSPALGSVLVFSTSAAVLILEIMAGRLLAPYVGVTLETFTAIVGTVLAGIALGTWAGGRLADAVDPRRLVGPELALGGVTAMFTVPMARLAGPAVGQVHAAVLIGLVLITVFLPAAILSAVPPTVVKLVLADLDHTGRVVGRLSAVGTAGAIVGTFVSGFVLVPLFSTAAIILGVAALLALSGCWLWWRLSPSRAVLVMIPLALVGATITMAVDGPCDLETRYYCARVVVDPESPSGRFLVLDMLDHSYVDLEDPTVLRFSYTRMLAAVVDATTSGPIDVVHLGGGGLSLPRWLTATRPGSQSIVLELDPELVELATEQLGWRPGPEAEVRTGDGRLTMRRLPNASTDIVIGDAFGGIAVPWHLTTTEFIDDIAAVLRPGGVYAANLIDRPGLGLVRAEAATLAEVFQHVAVVSLPERFEQGGNFVVVGSDRPIPGAAIGELGLEMGLTLRVVTGPELVELVDGAAPLTDDHAPVDQLLRAG